MTHVHVPLDPLLRRLAETPPSLRRAPRREDAGEVHVDAVVRDVLESLGPVAFDGPVRALLGLVAPRHGADVTPRRGADVAPRKGAGVASQPAADERTLATTLVAAWLVADPVFAQADDPVQRAAEFLLNAVPPLARAVEPSLFVTDADRREELVRRALLAFGLTPGGETDEIAADRLAALDSVGRSGLLRDAWDRLKRGQAIREAMRRKEAEESAARWGGE